MCVSVGVGVCMCVSMRTCVRACVCIDKTKRSFFIIPQNRI